MTMSVPIRKRDTSFENLALRGYVATASTHRVEMHELTAKRAALRRSRAGWVGTEFRYRSPRRPTHRGMGRKAIDNGLDTCESRPNRHIGRPASFARRPDKVNSHPIPYTQTDIRTMATQIDASSEAAAATAAAQHTPMMHRSFRPT
nr:hypothetical protein [Burkholderia pseudomallei]